VPTNQIKTNTKYPTFLKGIAKIDAFLLSAQRLICLFVAFPVSTYFLLAKNSF
jgi:hypothetical protein